MFSSRSDYDRSVNSFSPEGRIHQIEYALEAIKLGSTCIGIQTSDGVVIAAEKRIQSRLMEPASVVKIMEIDNHIGCVMSGLVADARILVEHARVESQHHRFTYDEPIAVEACTLSTCDLSLQFGEGRRKKALSRPFGVSLLIAGVDEQGPQLWQTDPSGTYIRYDAQAIGAGADAAQSVLVDQYHRSMTLDEATKLVVKILKQVMEETLTSKNIDVAVVKVSTKKLQVLSNEEIQTIIASIDP